MKVLVLSAKPYSIENDGEKAVKGASLWYVNPNDVTDDGLIPLKLSVAENSDFYGEIKGSYPFVCDLEYGMVAGKGNKASLKLVGLKRLSDFNLSLDTK